MAKEKYIGNSSLLGIPDSKLGWKIKPGVVTLEMLATEVLNFIRNSGGGSGGIGINLIDISERMTESSNTITDMEIKTSLFLYNAYNRVSAIARVVEPQSNERYALFKVSYYDETDNENRIVYIAYTTEDDFTESATWHYSKVIGGNDTLYPWAMSVFGDAVVDVENNLLTVGSIQYMLERYAGQDVTTYEYNTPEITDFSYPKVDANGGTMYPTVWFEQSIIRTVTNSAGSTSTALKLTGKFTEGSKFDYNDYGLATLNGNGAVLTFTGNNPYQSGGIDTTGKVILGPSDNKNERSLRTVTATVSINGKTSDTESANVWQYGATIAAPKTVNVSGNGVNRQITSFSKTAGVTVERSDVTCEASWISDINVNVSDTEVSIQYTVATNSASSSRTGVINIETDVAGLSTSLTVVQGTKEAAITVSKSNVAFGSKDINGTYYDTVRVTGVNLSENITVSKTGNSAFTVSASSISSAQASGGYDLQIMFKPVNTNSVTGTITLSSGSASATVSLSGSGRSASPESIAGYSGKGSSLPTAFGSNTFAVTNGMTFHDDGGAIYIWIALPTSLNATVNGTGILGAAFDVHHDHTIGDYTVYYRKTVIPAGLTDFTITF